jgi:hypothetical protein
MGIAEQPKTFQSLAKGERVFVDNVADAVALARLLAPVSKAVCSKNAIAGLQECMESLGGVGYLEDEQEFNIARLFREVNVCSIWEGTTDVLAHDVVRVIKGRSGPEVRQALVNWTEGRLKSWKRDWDPEQKLIRERLEKLEELFESGNDILTYHGRAILEDLAWIVAAVMLVEDANQDGDKASVETARRWILPKSGDISQDSTEWKQSAVLDRLIAFGSSATPGLHSPETARL